MPPEVGRIYAPSFRTETAFGAVFLFGICKQAVIKVAYCAEQFDNDDSMVSSIVKNVKRVMAAEYSRELSAKVHAGACQFASLGFQLGGPVAYALQRVLVNETLQPKEILEKGDRKYLQTDHVRLQPSAANEVGGPDIGERIIHRTGRRCDAWLRDRPFHRSH